MAVDVLCSEVAGLYETQVKSFLVPGILLGIIFQAWQIRCKVFQILPSSDRREGAAILDEVVIIH